MSQVALESTVFVHGLPHPHGLELALDLEHIVRDRGATPRTIGIIGGQPIVGLSEEQIRFLAGVDAVEKASTKGLPAIVSRRAHAATTVASTVRLGFSAGIRVVCTGGIGGVHRGSATDVSNDLTVLASTPLTVVCSGAKAILDLAATREFLETAGVTIVGYGTDELPAFYSRSSGIKVDVALDTAAEVAEVVAARDSLALSSAILVCVPVPEGDEVPSNEIEASIVEALDRAASLGIEGAKVTPFLLSAVAESTGGRSLAANLALLRNNAAVAADIAVALG